MRKLKLHTKITIGLVLGAAFVSLFSINPNRLEIIYSGKKAGVSDWTTLSFLIPSKTGDADSVIRTFDANSQLSIIKSFKAQADKKKLKIRVSYPDTAEAFFENVTSVEKVRTIGVMLRAVGDIFVRLLTMIAVPLVLASLIVGAASLSDLKHVAKVGGKTLGFYAMTAVVAITVGLVCVNPVIIKTLTLT